jgi:signal recognition particle receptor subunit alpha
LEEEEEEEEEESVLIEHGKKGEKQNIIMLESLTIFSKGGLILYQYTANPSVMDHNNTTTNTNSSQLFTLECLNEKLIPKVFLSNSSGTSPSTVSTATLQSRHWIDGSGAAYVWLENAELYVVAIYPDILFDGPRLYLQQWAKVLVATTLTEYNLFYQSVMKDEENSSKNSLVVRPDPALFDATFQVLLEQAKTARPEVSSSSAAAATTIIPNDDTQNDDSSNTKKTTGSSNKAGGGKEKRNWHDGTSKVTDKAMAELDFSKAANSSSSASGSGNEQDQAAAKLVAQERALQEARAAYLPTDEDLAEAARAAAAAAQSSLFTDGEGDSTDASLSSSSSWSASALGLLQQLTGNKILQASDLEVPLQQIQQMLVRNNVSQDIADELCAAIRQKLLGKRLKSLARVQTAVRQALEERLEQILRPSTQVDLMQNVVRQRGDYSSSLFFKKSSNSKRPYVIAVIGINGVGKSTSLAKLAYYFCQHDCHPMLVAGDTFRSGAVEQLAVHAKCLNVPMFSRGYSKDPSAVVKAAIAHASSSTNPATNNNDNSMDDGEDPANWKKNDVVLCDTAGRMQNNVPLMNALGKLVQENQPDFVLLVVEALVGHDGLNQFTMFQNAVKSKSGRGIDGLILTKFDTVSDKVGAALTLTRQTGVPIVFIGTGQKYHHLQKLSVPSVINSLFS